MANDFLIDMLASLSLESGVTTSSAEPGTIILIDNTKNWARDKFKHCMVRIVYGKGAGQLVRITGNSADSLQVSPSWKEGLDTSSIYIIYQPEVSDQVDRILTDVNDLLVRLSAARADLLDRLTEITAARMAELDPANLPADIAAILALVGGISGGANWSPYGPRNVEVGNDVTAGVTVYDPGGGVIPQADVTEGTYEIDRVRGAVLANIVPTAPSSKADGLVFASYDFPGANWQVGDIFIITFSDVSINIGGTITSLPPVQMYGRVVREADIQSIVTAIDTNVGAIEGATDLHNKLTAARCLLLDRLALLAAGGAGELTPARALLLDNLDALVSSRAAPGDAMDLLAATITAIRQSVTGIGDPANSIGKALYELYVNRLTAARALLLDEITALRMAELDAANIPADIDELKASEGRQLFSMDFWSNPQEEVSIPSVAGTLTLPSVTVAGLPAGATIVRAIAMVKFRIIENTNAAANKLDGATVAATSQVIQVDDSGVTGFVDAINFVDDQFSIEGETREGGDVLIGSINISARVVGNDTYSLRYLLAKADLDTINWNDVQVGLRILYSV